MEKYIQVYTGEGKGKTTAALGVALRILGCGGNVLFAQFAKNGNYSEIKALKMFKEQVQIMQCGAYDFIYDNPSKEDLAEALDGWEKTEQLVENNKFDLIVLDELNIALYFKLLETSKIIERLRVFKEQAEVIVTGQKACAEILELADLVTEMKEVKHYYNEGVIAREGIEF